MQEIIRTFQFRIFTILRSNFRILKFFRLEFWILNWYLCSFSSYAVGVARKNVHLEHPHTLLLTSIRMPNDSRMVSLWLEEIRKGMESIHSLNHIHMVCKLMMIKFPVSLIYRITIHSKEIRILENPLRVSEISATQKRIFMVAFRTLASERHFRCPSRNIINSLCIF
jgi:hypothetical protein